MGFGMACWVYCRRAAWSSTPGRRCVRKISIATTDWVFGNIHNPVPADDPQSSWHALALRQMKDMGGERGWAIQLERTSEVKDRRASGMTGSEPGLSPPSVSAMLIVRRKRKLPCPRLQIRAELFPHIGTISEITRLTSECGYILNQYLLQKFLLKVLFQCESNLQWKGDGDFRKTDAKIPTEYMENHVISLDSCGEYYLAVDGEIGGRP